VVTAPGHPLTSATRVLRLRDCLDYSLVMMSPDMELRSMLERIDPRLARLGRPLVETSSVPMVRRLVAGGQAVSFLIPDNVAEEVQTGTLVWVGLEDAGARLHSCLYQRPGYTTAVAMGLFLGALDAAVSEIRERFETRHALRRKAVTA
jgi:DNA-binding transcriptional LysR family regulator